MFWLTDQNPERNIKNRALLPCFFLTLAILFTLAGSFYFSHILLFLPLAIGFICIAITASEKVTWTWLTLTVCLFVINILISIFIFSPVYDAAAAYYIFYLFLGYLLASTLLIKHVLIIFKITVSIFIVLSAWALAQHFTGEYYISDSSAPNTIFTTKNTFAAALNFVLLPVSIIACTEHGRRWHYMVAVILFCGLLVSISRGAYIAFTLGFIFVSLYAFRYVKSFSRKRWSILLLSLVFCVGLINFNGAAYAINRIVNHDQVDSLKTMKLKRVASSNSWKDRLYYYDIAFKQIKDSPIKGYGFLNYKYYFHVDKSPDLYGQSRYGGFVHNDYLQIWLETGLIGLILLLMLVGLVYFYVHKVVSTGMESTITITAIAIGGALTAYFIHALVDFVLYPPLLLLMFGAYLAYLNRLQEQKLFLSRFEVAFSNLSSRKALLKTIATVLLVAWLSQAAIAEAYWLSGNDKSQKQQYDKALNNYLTAINFADYNVDYYFNAGRLYFTSAESTGNKQHAMEADRLFRQASEVNPFEYHNRFARIKLHRDHADLLDNPASREQILAWFEHILYWQPMHQFIMQEYIKTLVQFEQTEYAGTQYENYLEYFPSSDELARLFENEKE